MLELSTLALELSALALDLGALVLGISRRSGRFIFHPIFLASVDLASIFLASVDLSSVDIFDSAFYLAESILFCKAGPIPLPPRQSTQTIHRQGSENSRATLMETPFRT
jgi:hypothetical protein